MKILYFLIIGLLTLGSVGCKSTQMFQSVNPDVAELVKSDTSKHSCSVCGMNLTMFYKTSHAGSTKDGAVQYCSIHCLVDDIENNKVDVNEVKVVDVTSLKLIPVTEAVYVVGSKKRGTMSMVSKYAFKNRADAEFFHNEHGGEIMNFHAAYSKAKEYFIKPGSHSKHH